MSKTNENQKVKDAKIEQIDTPESVKKEASEQNAKAKEAKAKADEFKQRAKSLNEYQKSLRKIKELEDLTQHSAWKRRVEAINKMQIMAEDGLKHGDKKDFDTNQAVYKVCESFFQDLSDECDKHNAFIEAPGHLPLWRDPKEPPVRAEWDEENLVVRLRLDNDLVIDESVAKEVEESNADDEGSTD